jgi:hypothetical protein
MLQVIHEIGGPDLIRAGEEQDLDLVIRIDDAVPSVALVTFTLKNKAGETVVNARAASVASAGEGRLRVTMEASDTTTDDCSLGWRGFWNVTDSDGVVHKFTRDYAVCRYASSCPVSSDDLYALHSTLRDELPPGETSWKKQILQAWILFTENLYQRGRRHWLIVTQGSPRKVVLYETLKAIYTDARNANSRYRELADRYSSLAESAWDELKVGYDSDEDGVEDTDRAAEAVILLTSGPPRRRLVYG